MAQRRRYTGKDKKGKPPVFPGAWGEEVQATLSYHALGGASSKT